MKEPRWMPAVLWAASAHCLFWGGLLIISPLTPFRWAGVALPNCSESWQAVGLLLGAQGAGYSIAARDPLRHWLVVLVGLLGKILAPGLILWHAWQGRLPWTGAWVILASAAIWWLPFGFLLKRAAAAWRAQEDIVRSAAAAPPKHILEEYRTQRGENLAELTQGSAVLLVFVRHAGCPFCREALSDLKERRSDLERAGVRLVVVHQSSGTAMTRLLGRYALADVDVIRDTSRRLYRAFGLRRGSLRQLLGPKVWWRVWLAAGINRHRLGAPDGSPSQMPGMFLLHEGRILRGYYHRSAADRPDYRAFCAAGLRARETASGKYCFS